MSQSLSKNDRLVHKNVLSFISPPVVRDKKENDPQNTKVLSGHLSASLD